MGKKDKFFGAIEEEVLEVEEKVLVDNEALIDALSADDEVEVAVSIVDESVDEVIVDNVNEELINNELLPNTALSYYRDGVTGLYHLVTVDYNPATGATGNLNIDKTRTAMDRLSIEEEFKIAVVNNVFSQ